MMTIRSLARCLALVAMMLAGPIAAHAQPPTDARDQYVPVDQLQDVEELPAAPLVAAAYGIAWIAVLAYVWTLWNRLNRVDKELAEVARRIEPGARQ